MDFDLQSIPFFPHDQEGPVFPAPWAARAFAMTLKLSHAGHFSWPDWVAAFSAELSCNEHGAHARAGDFDDYYECWVNALEGLLAQRRILSSISLKATCKHTILNWPEPNHVAHRGPVARSLPLA